jgi:hypothetical protein
MTAIAKNPKTAGTGIDIESLFAENKKLGAGANAASEIAGGLSSGQGYDVGAGLADIGKYTAMGSSFGLPGAIAGAVAGTGMALYKKSKSDQAIDKARAAEKKAVAAPKDQELAALRQQGMANGGQVERKEGEALEDYIDRATKKYEFDPILVGEDQISEARNNKKFFTVSDREKFERNLLNDYLVQIQDSVYGDNAEDVRKELMAIRRDKSKTPEDVAEYIESVETPEMNFEEIKGILGEQGANDYYDLLNRSVVRHSKRYPDAPTPILGKEEHRRSEGEGDPSELINSRELLIGQNSLLYPYWGEGKKRDKNEGVPDKAQQELEQEQNQGMAEGGEIEGKGTQKSDSNKAKADPGDVIIPANGGRVGRKKVKQMMKDIGLTGKAKMDKGDKNIKVSDDEFFVPAEKKDDMLTWLDENEFSADDLAPNAKNPISEKKGFASGTIPYRDAGVDNKQQTQNIIEDLLSLGSDFNIEGEKRPEGTIPFLSAGVDSKQHTQNAVEDLMGLGSEFNEKREGSVPYRYSDQESNNKETKDGEKEKDKLSLDDTLGYILGGAQVGTGVISAMNNKMPNTDYDINANKAKSAVDMAWQEAYENASKWMTSEEKEALNRNLDGIQAQTFNQIREFAGNDPVLAANLASKTAGDIAEKYTSLASAEARDRRNMIQSILEKKASEKSRLGAEEYGQKVAKGKGKADRRYNEYMQDKESIAQLIASGAQNVIGQSQMNKMEKRYENMPETSVYEMLSKLYEKENKE